MGEHANKQAPPDEVAVEEEVAVVTRDELRDELVQLVDMILDHEEASSERVEALSSAARRGWS